MISSTVHAADFCITAPRSLAATKMHGEVKKYYREPTTMSIPVPKGTQGVAPTAQTREEATLLMLTRLEECGLVEGSQFRGLGSHELLSLGRGEVRRKHQVLGVIRLTLSRSVAHNVMKETTTVALMMALSGMYEKPLANNKVHLMKKLFNLKMAEGIEEKNKHNIDDEWVVDSAATHHVVHTKELFTTYKAGDFGTVKMGNTSYSKIVGIAGYYNHLGNGRWKLAKGPMVVARGHICYGLYKTRVKACKKKFNAVGTIEKTPQLRVKVNCVTPKRIKFSLADSATDGGAICDEEYRNGKPATCDEDEVKDSKDLEQGE
uniref:Retrovirus-related Pol polyprotein from transposon TNT 1-94-like beta-barrel domain-containing protein n=1 Tax=Fagus sylvatica TaxID=28930 RepID=A0A2N9IKM5_FAGSY